MKLFLDNTGLHSIGRCLDGDAQGEPDIAGLLQFATQLVFSDQLFFATFCGSEVAARSQDVSEQVARLGVGSDVLRHSPSDTVSYDRATFAAAERLARDLKFSFGRTSTEAASVTTCLPDANPLDDRHYRSIHRAIKSATDSSRSELAAEGTDMELVGSGARLVTASTNLWREASRLAQGKSWQTADTGKLIVMLRCYLNHEVATLLSESERDDVDFSPCVRRARTIQTQDAYVLAKLSEIVGAAARKLDGIRLEAPPVALALVLKAKSDPKGIIAEALVAREKAAELRRHLREVVRAARKETSSDTEAVRRSETIDRLRQAVRELAILLEQDLGVAPRVGLRDALEANMVGPVPMPPPRKMLEWVMHKWHRPRITILSEFAKTLANPTNDKFALRRLYAACGHEVKPAAGDS